MSDQGRLVVGRYRLLEQIGRGGMGTVWRAEDQLLGRQVALKKLRVPPQLLDDERETLYERTRREARSAARITHPNVVVVHDVVDDAGLPCVVMEYVHSRTLGEVINKDGPVSQREAVRVGRGMLAALRAAHHAGVLHRDVKPANVLLETDPAAPPRPTGTGPLDDHDRPGRRVVLTDFGIAALAGTSTLTRTGELIGSFDYLAPERIRGHGFGPAADLWALGATLYQALEGHPPFRRPTAIETAYAIATDDHPPLQRAGALTPIIEGLLAKDPDRRMTAEDVERMLAGSMDTVLSSGAWPTRVQPRPAGPDDPGPAPHTPPAPYPAHPHPTGPVHPHLPPPPAPAEPHTVAGPHGPAPGGSGPRRRALFALGGLAVAAGLGGAGAWWLGRDDGTPQGRPGPPSTRPPSPRPSPSTPATLPPVPPVPEGHQRVDDPMGFSVTVPSDWERTALEHGQEVNYVDPTGQFGLKFNVIDFAGQSPLEHWRAIEPEVEAKSPGYQSLRMNETRYQGRRAAIWEFTWQGSTRPWRAVDLGFSAPGEREYAIYLSAPADQWGAARPYFDTATESFRLASP